MKSKFEEMSKSDLIAYVMNNRQDIEAIRVLFTPPPGVEIKRYPPMFTDDGQPIEENIRIAEDAMREKFAEDTNKKQQINEE